MLAVTHEGLHTISQVLSRDQSNLIVNFEMDNNMLTFFFYYF